MPAAGPQRACPAVPRSQPGPAHCGTLVLAGLSVRAMAEAAVRDGYRVIALDCFGDRDTRAAAVAWHPIGSDGEALRIDAPRLLGALTALGAAGPADGEAAPLGWIAGSDLEGRPALLAQAAARLPLLGTAPPDVQRLRDPVHFFATLDRLALPHPPTQLAPPADPHGWLRKLAHGSGGWHIRAADGALPPVAADRRPYFQRLQPGRPMSALFLGNGSAARLIGCNALLVRPLGAHPCVFRGAVGPVALPAAAHARLDAMLQALSAAFTLRGLASLDFIADGDADDPALWLLEINPRPSASMALYPHLPLLQWHLDACRHGRLPAPPSAGDGGVRGVETVFAPVSVRVSSAHSDALVARGDCHDLPPPDSAVAPGAPFCSVSAAAPDADAVRAALAGKRHALRAALVAAADASTERHR